MSGATLAYLLIGVGMPVVLTAAAFAYGRRPDRSTLTMMSTGWLRRGDVFRIDTGDLVIVRRVVNTMTLEVVPYAGWRKLAHRARARLRYRWRRITDTVYGWFERDDDDE